MKSFQISKTNFDEIDILVLDNTAFMSGFNLNIISSRNSNIKMYITSFIYDEIAKNPNSLQIVSTAISQKYLKILDPTSESLEYIKMQARKSGDLGALSAPDQSIIALCADFLKNNVENKVFLMSDDYSIQNTCQSLKIPIITFQKAGIKHKIKWQIYCPNCFQTFKSEELGIMCDHCGGITKRRKYRKTKKRL